MSNDFNYCPICKSEHIQYKDNRKWYCSDCGFDLYNNVASAVGCIITNKKGEVLFEVRGKEPRKGFLALPGGFCDPDESAEEAVIRECKEELGVDVSDVKYLCSFPNTYEYRSITYKTCDLFFTAVLKEGEEFKEQKSEVAGTVWKSVNKELFEKLAFESAKKALTKWTEEKVK